MSHNEKKNIKIAQLNIRSIKTNKDELEKFINSEGIDIMCIAETWTKEGEIVKIRNHNVYIKNRSDGYGGVGIIINNKINIKEIKSNNAYNPIENISATITDEDGNQIEILSIYIPPNINNNIINNKFKKIINKYKNAKRSLLIGDINAHHSLWEQNSNIDNRGRKMAEIINNSQLIILNNGEDTWIGPNERSSAIDVTLTTPDIYNNIEWCIKMIKIGNTDHLPIITDINKINIGMNEKKK